MKRILNEISVKNLLISLCLLTCLQYYVFDRCSSQERQNQSIRENVQKHATRIKFWDPENKKKWKCRSHPKVFLQKWLIARSSLEQGFLHQKSNYWTGNITCKVSAPELPYFLRSLHNIQS